MDSLKKYTRKIIAVFLIINLSVYLWSRPVVASVDRFQAFNLWPSVGDDYFAFMSSPQGLFQGRYTFSVSNNYMYRPLSLLNAAGVRIGSVIGYSFQHFVSAGYGFTDFLQVGVTLPVMSRFSFVDPSVLPTPAKQTFFDIGDVRVTSKIRILDDNRTRFGFALQPYVSIPTGADEHFMGEPNVVGGVELLGDFIVNKSIRVAASLGVEIRGDRVIINNIDFTHRLTTALGVSGQLSKKVSLEAEVHTISPFRKFYSNQDTIPFEYLGAVKWNMGKGFALGAGAGSCLVCGSGASIARGFLNLNYKRTNKNFELKEQEAERMKYVTLKLEPETTLIDRLNDLKKRCPTHPEEYNPAIHGEGCEELFKLREAIVELSGKSAEERFKEVFLDLKQNCPEKMKDFDPEKHNAECARFFRVKENIVELAGITEEEHFAEVFLNYSKTCPANPRDFDPERDDAGCRKFYEIKNDTLPLIAKTDAERQAVDFMLTSEDQDRDSIPDLFDECPLDPEDRNGVADQDGCPETGVTFANGQVRTIAPVHFAFNQTKLTDESKLILKTLSEALFYHKEIKELTVIGHADPIGSPEGNQRISQKRAQVVVDYLKLRGVPDSLRLVPLGAGDSNPVAPNNTEEGRSLNRRVEFMIEK